MVEATVRFWREEKGWGVLDSPETPGGCWAHFSFIEMEGHSALQEGQVVDLEWELPPTGNYEGYSYFASRVVPR